MQVLRFVLIKRGQLKGAISALGLEAASKECPVRLSRASLAPFVLLGLTRRNGAGLWARRSTGKADYHPPVEGGTALKKADEYLAHAAECLALARKTPSQEEKQQLIKMAEVWRTLAATREATTRQLKGDPPPVVSAPPAGSKRPKGKGA